MIRARGLAAVLSIALLRAAEAGSRDEACRFVPDVAGQLDVALTRYAGLRAAVQGAGGVDRLALAVQPSRQMGAEHVVTASAGGALVAEFVVMEQSERFLVYPEAVPSSS